MHGVASTCPAFSVAYGLLRRAVVRLFCLKSRVMRDETTVYYFLTFELLNCSFGASILLLIE